MSIVTCRQKAGMVEEIRVDFLAHVDNEEDPHHRTVDACQTIRKYPGIFEQMRRSVMRRVDACFESRGGNIEHLL
ncbi:hypothetical protein B7P43_G03441 [Cryptotermes secundus]|uniref:Uncharacterized protein n=1 Tax=Cryptotermes secundus TaxID=105785 RepID=A0A2J7RLR2_9NEOP|nr:hypothetical protein B7P43_G03441 [Cryptotermes secundus]